jgi:hypothetical protein
MNMMMNELDMPSEDLIRSVEAGRRKLVRGMVVGGTISSVVSAAGVFKLWTRHDSVEAVLSAVALIGVPAAVIAFVMYSQRRAWAPRTWSTRGLLELELERAEDWIRRGRALRVLALVLMAVRLSRDVVLLRARGWPSIGTIGAEDFWFVIESAIPILVLVVLSQYAVQLRVMAEIDREGFASELAQLARRTARTR